MQERQIQQILENLIKEENFFSAITGVDQVEKLYNSFYDSDSLPSFSIDYFSRKKTITSAKNVLHSLKYAQLVTTASNNISLDRQEKLFPDLLLYDEEKNKLIILEIKRSNKTARETLTEMLAYEYEVKNLLPFLSNLEILYCIVSTDYSSLLNHSIAGLTTWESKQILCLKLNTDKEKIKLGVHFPSAWTSLGITNFPANAISTLQVILYNREDNHLLDAESAVFYAANLMTKEGDRNNSHGFVLVWRDCWENWEDVAGAAKFHLTVGFLNPYVFLPFAQSLGIVDASQSLLGQYLLKKSEKFLQAHSFCDEILEKSLSFLKQYFDVEIEGLSSWDTERLNPSEIYGSVMLTMRHRALPLHINLWGALGDFAREFVIHPGVKRHIISNFSGKIFGCENPFIGIPIIDSISGIKKIGKSGFTCKVLFELGVSLGAMSCLYHTSNHSKNNELINLPASIYWYALDIQPILLELGIQYKSSENLTVPPPKVRFSTTGNFQEALLSIQALINWIDKEFLSHQNEIYRICFDLGLTAYPLLDDYLTCGLSNEERKAIEEHICKISVLLLKTIVHICLSSDYIALETAESVIKKVLRFYFECDSLSVTKQNKDSLISLIDDVAKNKHIELYNNVLMNLIDEVTPSINYDMSLSSNLSDYKFIDWIWIKEEILNLRKNRVNCPAIKVNPLGEFDIVDISQEDYASLLSNKIDFEREFIFIISGNQNDVILINKWEELGL